MKKKILALAVVMTLSACGPSIKNAVNTAGPSSEDQKTLLAAETEARRGSYIALKEACRLYGALYGQASLKGRVAAGYFRAAFLLSLREKEIGILESPTITLSERLIRENSNLTGYKDWPEIVRGVAPRIKGVVKDFLPGISSPALGDEAKRRLEELRSRAGGDELIAYLILAEACPHKSPYDKVDDTPAILASHPDSLLLKFRSGFCPVYKNEVLEDVLKVDPEFYEAYGLLGEAALSKGEVLTAEQNLLRAYEHIPESPHYNILLASVYFFLEEFERGIEFSDQVIALAPDYRDAFLIKAISLSRLGRFPESITVLKKIVEMQYYLLGEAHYWLAWNYHELKDGDAAQDHIEESKGRLPMNSEVFGLAGTIALGKKEWDRAEREFKEALTYNARNHEAFFGLAQVSEQRQKWAEGAEYYEKAAGVMASNIAALADKITQIKASTLSEARKAKMIAKKETQLQISQMTKAMAYYNGAVDWINAGKKESARALAERAAKHPQFKDKVAALLESIKQ